MPEPWGGHQNGRIPLDELAVVRHATDSQGRPVHHLRLRVDAAAAIDRLLVQAKADGYDRWITDAYRDYATQVRLKQQKGVYAATPGTSNHGWAMATDNAYSAGPKSFGRWLWANERLALEHGWYPPAWTHDGRGIEEPWHWEYDHTVDRHRGETVEDHMFCEQGDKGPAVQFWQLCLRALDQPLKPDGDYGPNTVTAVAKVTRLSGKNLGPVGCFRVLVKLIKSISGKSAKQVDVDLEAIAAELEITVKGKP